MRREPNQRVYDVYEYGSGILPIEATREEREEEIEVVEYDWGDGEEQKLGAEGAGYTYGC